MDCDWSTPDGVPSRSPRCVDYIATIPGRTANLAANLRRGPASMDRAAAREQVARSRPSPKIKTPHENLISNLARISVLTSRPLDNIYPSPPVDNVPATFLSAELFRRCGKIPKPQIISTYAQGIAGERKLDRPQGATKSASTHFKNIFQLRVALTKLSLKALIPSLVDFFAMVDISSCNPSS